MPGVGFGCVSDMAESFQIIRGDTPGAGHFQNGLLFSYFMMPLGECNQTLPGHQLNSWRQRALLSRAGILFMAPLAYEKCKGVGGRGGEPPALPDSSEGSRDAREIPDPPAQGVRGCFWARGWGLWRGLWIGVERNFLRWKTWEVYPQHIVLPGLMRMAFCEGFQPPGNH